MCACVRACIRGVCERERARARLCVYAQIKPVSKGNPFVSTQNKSILCTRHTNGHRNFYSCNFMETESRQEYNVADLMYGYMADLMYDCCSHDIVTADLKEIISNCIIAMSYNRVLQMMEYETL